MLRLFARRAFSTTLVHAASKESTSKALVSKLSQEIEFESELTTTSTSEPEFLKAFQSRHLFRIHDEPGRDEVKLTRHYGDEVITVVFSTGDINNMEESTFQDEEEEEGVEQEKEEEEEEADALISFPFRLAVTIEKPGKGVLTMDMVSEEGELGFESITVNENSKEALELSAEADFKRRGNYMGPQFGHLDEDLQVLLEKYVEERGIDRALAEFVPNYIEWKEQREYVNWLKGVRKFVEE